MAVRQEIDKQTLIEEIARILDTTREVILRAKGRSMHPYIRDGKDNLVIHKADPATLTAGDMVLARTIGRDYVMHRIIKITADSIVLMGDGNLYGTETCRPADIIGKLAYIERDGRRIDCNTPLERLKAWLMRSIWRSARRAKHRTGKVIKAVTPQK